MHRPAQDESPLLAPVAHFLSLSFPITTSPSLLKMASSSELEAKMSSLEVRIQKEIAMIHGFQAMRSATPNQDVMRMCDVKIRESEKTIGWFQDSLNQLHQRLYQPPQPASQPKPDPTAAGTSPSVVVNTAQTSLDLIKADSPLTSAKISRMIHQLEFKMHIEKQYKEGIDKMGRLYELDGDKKARADTENKRVESRQKMQLLSLALKRYKQLDVMGDLPDEDDGQSRAHADSARPPLRTRG